METKANFLNGKLFLLPKDDIIILQADNIFSRLFHFISALYYLSDIYRRRYKCLRMRFRMR